MKAAAFHTQATLVRPLLASDALRTRWEDPSALALMTLGALGTHTARAVTTVLGYLRNQTEPASTGGGSAGPLVRPDGYFTAALTPDDPARLDQVNADVRERSSHDAAHGHAAMMTRFDEALAELPRQIAALPQPAEDHHLVVFGGLTMSLADYLDTRAVELVIHSDDLAVSLGVDPPAFDDAFVSGAIGTLVAVARARHGSREVLWALARGERLRADVFPVF
ncbi:MAG: hypothetical protein ACK5MP_11575 [Nostocoides sp.]